MGLVTNDVWLEERREKTILFRPASLPSGLIVAVSERGLAPDGDPSPTATLARRLARALGLGDIPIVRATQVHGTAARRVREAPPAGIAHAGWRGSAANAAGAAAEEMSRLGTPASALRAWLGPSIGSCCYEIGGEVAARFAGEFVRRSCNGRFTLDLRAVNRAQLEAAGIPPGDISTHPSCTRCGGNQFASYRRDGAAAGRMISLIALS
jgi:copper oxidase (laccase) domain-containing protein